MSPDDAGVRGDPANVPAVAPDCPELPLCAEIPGLWVGTCQNVHVDFCFYAGTVREMLSQDDQRAH